MSSDSISVETTDLEDVIEQIKSALSDLQHKSLTFFADRYSVDYDSSGHIVEAIVDMLQDTGTGSSTIIDLANEVIDDKEFTYEGDSIVSVKELSLSAAP